MKVRLLIMNISVLLISQSEIAIAETNKDLENYFADKIEQVQSSFLMQSVSEESKTGIMEVSDISFNINSSVSFGINAVMNLSIYPEIDFVLTPVE